MTIPFDEGEFPCALSKSKKYSVVVIDNDNRCVYVNNCFEREFGFEASTILGKPFPSDFFSPYLDSFFTCELKNEREECVEIQNFYIDAKGDKKTYNWEITNYKGGLMFVGENITHYKQDEIDKQFYLQMFDSVHQSVVATDANGRVLFWNKFAEKLFGWKKEEVLGKDIIDFVTSEKKEEAEGIINRLKNGESWEGEYLVGRKNDTPIMVFASDTPVLDEAGKLIGIIGTSTDLTKKIAAKKLDKEQKQRLEMLSLIAGKTMNAVVISDNEGKVEWVNEAFTKIFDFTPEEAMGKRPGELLRGKNSDPAVVNIINTALKNNTNYDVEIINYRKNGEPCWIRVQGQPLFDAENNRIGILDIASDITQQKEQQAQLLFQAHLLDSILQAVIVTDAAGTVTYWNKFAATLYGYTKQEALGTNIVNLLTPSTSEQQAIEIMEKLTAGEIWEGEFEVQRKDGTRFPAYVIDSPVYDDTGNLEGVMGVSFDITQTKEIERERKKSYSLLIKQYKKLKQFAHINAHDLRAPLTNILSITNLLKHDEFAADDEERKMYLKGLHNSAQQMDGVIRKLSSVLQGYQMDIDKNFFGVLQSEMQKQIVLIDDDPVQNLINKKIISNYYPKFELVDYTDAEEAFNDILTKKVKPDLIFLDLNMPFMDGWAFLEKLNKQAQEIDFEVQILTSSIDQNDFERARSTPFVSGITSKPLQKEILEAIL